jgi:peptidoglycan/xylan/chitin deacetylase (PgdA/CDA1 family)
VPRRREYYVGRRRRRTGRIVLVGLAVAAIAGATATGAYVAVANAPAQSNGPVAVTSPDASRGIGEPTPATTLAPVVTPAPSVIPEPTLPPCAPPSNIVPARVLSHGDFDEKVVALTFDDGTNPKNTEQILRILKREHVNATFFPTGRAMERFPDVWREVAKAGYPIANHTYGHEQLAGKCYIDQRQDLLRASAVFGTLEIPQFPAMRPPYELFDATTNAAAAAEGLQAVVLWNIDTNDWQGAGATSIRRTALHGGKGSIILMHTFPEATAAALPAIIKGFKARGFRFVTIGEILGIAGPVPFPEPTPG